MIRIGATAFYQRGALLPIFRRLHESSNPLEAKDAEEVRIPVPWGHIAGKWWGQNDTNPLIGLHGWEDNAGTFDNLAPMLKTSNFLAIDLPGHGLSSYYPTGRPYHLLDSVIILRRLMKYFNWNRVSLIGHSYGSCISFIFSALYPNYVDNYISIDCARTLMVPDEMTEVAQWRNIADNLDNIEKKIATKKPPEYTYDKLVDVLHYGSLESPSKKSCEVLLKRGMVSSTEPNKFYFARDPRLRFHSVGRLPFKFLLKLAPKITCNHLSIRGKQGLIFDGEKEEIYFKTLNLIKKEQFKWEHFDVEGTHHLHLNNPERVAPLINNFLESTVVGKL